MSEDAGLQTFGKRFVQTFYAALQALKLYPLENDTVQNSLDELQRTAAEGLKAEGALELRVSGDFFFLNELRLRLDLSTYATYGMVARAVERHGIGAIEIQSGVERDEWAPFLSLLLEEGSEPDPFGAFMGRLQGRPVRHIEVRTSRRAAEHPEEVDEQKENAKRSYVQTVEVAKEVLTDFRLGRAVNVRKVKRAVQDIVDQVLTNETSIMGMTTLREFDEYTFTHSVNVCIFSVVIGQRLDLDKNQLYELGLGALFHDIGKMRIDPEVLNKPGKLADDEWEEMRSHTQHGLLSLFDFKGFAHVPLRQMLIAYEHHMKVDLSGYPEPKRARDPSLFSRIVAVADGFDAATSVRSYQYLPKPPDKVLQGMRDDERWGMDPLIVKVFINLTGVYPVGTLVRLDSQELAVVTARNPSTDRLHQPIVKVISDPGGTPVPQPYDVDLSEPDPATGAPRRTIVQTLDAQKLGVNVGEYFL